MTKPVLRGLVITAFFAVVAALLIPVFVPRPAFIPGFAPPPDMWPRTVAIAGTALGVLALIAARLRPEPPEPVEHDGSSPTRMTLRFAGVVAAFAAFLALVPVLGFLVAGMALTAVMVLMTGERDRRFWIVALSIGGPVLLLVFFHSALGTQFPRGIFKPFGF
ncbi:tripartite tricarboxylate transporter TctB family protein [Paracoccus sp. 1_MG-2023]|uniref:tripartite tricarboxylate transporter TctB family protein n=1 Tax=unclassified Paracoccus (in: a-proteobacteria) TaxID=2688777 RepID=UPI001C094F8F|nr:MULTISPECIES: tripartite tricarboxylate transporter TctB family protein [unclassified Paracoccus (in: a-proteobacteria)]MBU2957731.1 tripartite tricarboxylate transporter TctB family protein [Paracoccus sp. C2R09]MDO6667421.1 tripartite tricarboxylate transporter TctB family protein [Paracoccus sp. 1_MG-2023]